MISATAHAYQPNFPNAYDPDHKVIVNKGVVIKDNANHRYSSESISEANLLILAQPSGCSIPELLPPLRLALRQYHRPYHVG